MLAREDRDSDLLPVCDASLNVPIVKMYHNEFSYKFYHLITSLWYLVVPQTKIT